MTAPTSVAIMDGIETRLDTIAGLRVSDISPGAISPPCAIVGVPDVPEYRSTMGRGVWTPDFTVTVLVSATMDRIGQKLLAAYADVSGASSIVAAIEGDRTLGGLVHECWVDSYRNLGLDEVGVIGYFGGVWTLRMSVPGS
jgi:hypothetical protein